MPFTADDIKFFYSGGAGNANPQASLGGVKSSTRVISQTASVPVNVTGVTIQSVTNNAQGVGLLAWSPSTNTLSWQPPTSSYTYSVSGVTSSGLYTVGGSDGTLVLNVTVGSLASIYKQDSITITNASQNVFDSVSPVNSLIGDISYRCLYIVNTNPSITVNDVKVWIKSLTSGPDEIDIGLDPAGIGNGTSTGVGVTIANENTAPAGVTFSRPLSYATGLSIGSLAPNQGIALWERRTVAAGTTGDITANTSSIAVALSV